MPPTGSTRLVNVIALDVCGCACLFSEGIDSIQHSTLMSRMNPFVSSADSGVDVAKADCVDCIAVVGALGKREQEQTPLEFERLSRFVKFATLF